MYVSVICIIIIYIAYLLHDKNHLQVFVYDFVLLYIFNSEYEVTNAYVWSSLASGSRVLRY